MTRRLASGLEQRVETYTHRVYRATCEAQLSVGNPAAGICGFTHDVYVQNAAQAARALRRKGWGQVRSGRPARQWRCPYHMEGNPGRNFGDRR